MAPEMGQSEYGKEVDVYALGCLLEEMVTLHFLYEPPVASVPWHEALVVEVIAGTCGLFLRHITNTSVLVVAASLLAGSIVVVPKSWLYYLSMLMRAHEPSQRPTLAAVELHLKAVYNWPTIAATAVGAILSLEAVSKIVSWLFSY